MGKITRMMLTLFGIVCVLLVLGNTYEALQRLLIPILVVLLVACTIFLFISKGRADR